MNRQLLVTLLHKNIEELGMITESLMEPGDLSHAIILLAKRKTEDIQTFLSELSAFATDNTVRVPENSASDLPMQENKLPVTENQQDEILTTNDAPESEAATPEVSFINVPTPENEPATTSAEAYAEEIALNIDEDESGISDSGEVAEIIDLNDIKPDEDLILAQSTNTEQETQPIADAVQESPSHDNKVMTIADKIAFQTSSSRNETMGNRDNSLSASIANKKVTDIKQAISIGDRFRFQRELFRSNGEDMNKTLTYLNLLATLDEAMAFLNSKYGWDPENQAAEDFYQIVKRKFL